ncbi:hypothetical protein [Mobilicoccus pelagius]|uniref:Uncharacterized protein n=1 Tax=Mobilicoccus pelagius NBRC 104925 TaxID=1089455 RepID=H5UME4_9MICO|nr:hypothetical protein [Mobilicoccus pelagius]GAB46902.1 hypothetical protein MOPEL_001_00200 [Mobilicoccus pelagius NBRC 104925]
MIGTPDIVTTLLVLVVPWAITLFVLHWVIRLGVRHGVLDATAARVARSAMPTGSVPPSRPQG